MVDQSWGLGTVRPWLTVAVELAPTLLAALVSLATDAPLGSKTVVVTVTDWELVNWFCTSVLTDTLAELLLTVGVLTKTPLLVTWMGLTTVNQTLR